jgi:hypothetical protein
MVVRSPVRSPVRSVVLSVLGGFGGAVSAETPDTSEIEILTRDGSTILTRDGATVIARS